MAFIDPETQTIKMEDLQLAVELATRIGIRQTNITFDLPEWEIVQKRDRLTGVSLSGVMDFESALGWVKTDDSTHSISAELAVVLDQLRFSATQEALMYAKEMRIAAPLLVTTEKPSGSISKMPSVSAGVHQSRAPYYLRRIRITASDPLAKVMLDAGYPVYPLVTANGPTEQELIQMKPFELSAELQKASTWVIEFPVKTKASMKSSDESAVSQFGRYLDFQKYWTEHNTSITIEFSPDEIPELIDMIYTHWDSYIGVSFIVKDTNAYPQMPEEVITESEYNRRAALLQDITQQSIVNALMDVERENRMSDILDSECIGGMCPIR